MKFAVVKSGGKQYLVHENEEILVDKMEGNQNDAIELQTLAVADGEKIDLGAPLLKQVVKGQILEQLRGDKVRVMRFKAKTRYRKTTGFRADLTKVKILSI